MNINTAVLVVSFGTTFLNSKAKTIDAVSSHIRQTFTEWPVYEAFTSQVVRRKLRERHGIEIPDVAGALGQMEAEGIENVLVLPMHLVDGIENMRMKEDIAKFEGAFKSIGIANTLLETRENIERTAEAVWKALAEVTGEDSLVFMGHGTASEADRSFEIFRDVMRNRFHVRSYVATVSGKTGIRDVVRQMREDGIPDGQRVVVTPLMLTAGRHASLDMMGEGEDSFVSVLSGAGYDPDPVVCGIGEYEGIQELYAQQLFAVAAGKLTGIGVGPGDPKQLTLRALESIEECETVILPGAPKEECYAYKIVREVCPDIERKKILARKFPMVRDKKKMNEALDEIYQEIRRAMLECENACFLTIGDPTVYSTYQYIRQRFEADGGRTETVSGISSFTAAAARLGISLGDGSEEIHIIPAGDDDRRALGYPGTKVFMKSGKRLEALLEVLKTREDISVCGVSNCGMQNERIYRSLEEVDPGAGYLTILIVK